MTDEQIIKSFELCFMPTISRFTVKQIAKGMTEQKG